MTTPLTPQEIEEERIIAKRRVDFLDSKLAALSLQQRQQLMTKLAETAKQAVDLLCENLVTKKILASPDRPISVNLVILSSKEMPTRNGRTVSGAAWPDKGTIGVLNHLVFAPEEVIRSLVIHECLHMLYTLTQHKPSKQLEIRGSIKDEYSEPYHVEEEWVRRMEAEICGLNHNLEYWELAVEEFGDNWKPAYDKLIGSGSPCGF